jgi:hypothetical protein
MRVTISFNCPALLSEMCAPGRTSVASRETVSDVYRTCGHKFGEQESETYGMGTYSDDDRNLVFDHELTPGQDDDGRSISGMEVVENKFHREGGPPDGLDDDGQEVDQNDLKRKEAKARHAERGAQERKHLLGLAKQEPGSAVVNGRGTIVEGLKWKNGQLVDRPWTEHRAFQESVRRQNAFQRAENQFHGGRGLSFKEAGYVPPDPNAPDYQPVKAVSGVATTSIKRRLSKVELQKRGKLSKLATRFSRCSYAG